MDKTLRLHQSCCLLYLSYMMTFYGLNNKALRKKGNLMSTITLAAIAVNFTKSIWDERLKFNSESSIF